MTETLNSPSPSGTSRLRTMLAGSPYQAYVYAYPHKTAYRTFAEPLALDALWSEQDRSASDP